MRVVLMISVFLLAIAVAATSRSAPTTVPAAPPQWRPIVSPDTQVFPALLIATANLAVGAGAVGAGGAILGDHHGMVGVAVAATRDDQRARVVVRAPALGRESSIEVRLPRAGDWYQIYPTMLWDWQRLHGVRRAMPETIEFALELDGHEATHLAKNVRVRSVNEAPYFVNDGNQQTDLSWMFAAYVDEEHPLVQKILGDALRVSKLRRFDGYQSKDPEQVYRQVFAVWQVLAQRGIRYSSITRTSSSNKTVLSQYVRFLDESWDNRQANCVDGSVLLASVLRRIDLDPQLVLVPGHMLLAFALDARGGNYAYLETTFLGKADASRSTGKADGSAALANFEAAVEEGIARYAASADRFGHDAYPEYRIVDIAAARKLGVAPISSR